MKITFRFMCYHWNSCRGDFYISKGNFIRIIVKYTHSLCSTLTVCDQENINQVTQKTVIYTINSRSVQGFWKLSRRRFVGGDFCTTQGWFMYRSNTSNRKNHLNSYAVGVQMIFSILKFLPIHVRSKIRILSISTVYW